MGPVKDIVSECIAWINRDWTIRVTYTPRETNKVADELAKNARRNRCDWFECTDSPVKNKRLVEDDKISLSLADIKLAFGYPSLNIQKIYIIL